MPINNGVVVELDYTICSPTGEQLEKSSNQVVINSESDALLCIKRKLRKYMDLAQSIVCKEDSDKIRAFLNARNDLEAVDWCYDFNDWFNIYMRDITDEGAHLFVDVSGIDVLEHTNDGGLEF